MTPAPYLFWLTRLCGLWPRPAFPPHPSPLARPAADTRASEPTALYSSLILRGACRRRLAFSCCSCFGLNVASSEGPLLTSQRTATPPAPFSSFPMPLAHSTTPLTFPCRGYSLSPQQSLSPALCRFGSPWSLHGTPPRPTHSSPSVESLLPWAPAASRGRCGEKLS